MKLIEVEWAVEGLVVKVDAEVFWVEVIGVEVGVKVVGTDGGNVVRESNLEDEVVGDPVC